MFWLRLSLIFGMPRSELQARMSSAEFAEYLAFHSIEPIGEERSDLRAGIIAATVAGAHGSRAKPIDFMPFTKQRDGKQSPGEMLSLLKMQAGMMGGRTNGRSR